MQGDPFAAPSDVRVTVDAKSMADLILCPIGMVLCDAMLGEVTANMALAVGRSKAHKILLPVSRCQASVAGAPKMSMAEVVAKAVEETVTRVSADSV